jgi:hypothetical protein
MKPGNRTTLIRVAELRSKNSSLVGFPHGGDMETCKEEEDYIFLFMTLEK